MCVDSNIVAFAPELANQRPHLADLIGVEPDGRLVEDQDWRPREDRVGQPHPLPVAARQRPDDLAPPLAEPHLSMALATAADARAARSPRRRGAKSRYSSTRMSGGSGTAFGQVADLRAAPPGSLGDRVAGQLADPRVGARKPVRIRIIVVLPAPFGPSSPTISPRPTSNDTPSSAGGRPSPGAAVGLRQTRRRVITRLNATSLEAAVAQRSVVLAAQVADLVQQRPGDRAVELGASSPTVRRRLRR